MEGSSQVEAPDAMHPDDSRGLSPIVKVGTVFVVLAGALAFLLFGSEASDAFVYSKLVHEVTADPGRFQGRELRVEGDLKMGSVKFREDPCEWRFTLKKKGEEMPVRFPECVVPDTFRDDMPLEVTVQGTYQENGTFLANQVIPRCPSKYEMKQRKADGEDMPHGPNGPEGAKGPEPMGGRI